MRIIDAAVFKFRVGIVIVSGVDVSICGRSGGRIIRIPWG
jgi:hypothetical protein